MQCKYCGTEYDNKEIDNLDHNNNGFWCNDCDGYNFFNSKDINNHRFTLILEEKSHKEIRIKSIEKFNKRISPLRYPGGKSKLINYLYNNLNKEKLEIFVEVYAGGASVGLALLEKGLINKLILNDADYGVYSLFWLIKNNPEVLISYINNNPKPTHQDYFTAQNIIKSNYKDVCKEKAGIALLLVNRLSFSGICKANPLGGKGGTEGDLLSRWNPKDLLRRIGIINSLSDKIEVYNMDACELISEYYWYNNCTLFIDPPYVAKGKDLYNCYYSKDDHIQLNCLLDNLYKEFPCSDILLTYDNDPLIQNIYLYPKIEKFSRVYSI